MKAFHAKVCLRTVQPDNAPQTVSFQLFRPLTQNLWDKKMTTVLINLTSDVFHVCIFLLLNLVLQNAGFHTQFLLSTTKQERSSIK